MANRIKPLRRVGSTGQPNIANMQEGEIAVNSYDQKIWMRVGSNLVEIANAGGSVTWGDISGKPSITAGNGLTGGGLLDTSKTITLGTPSTLSGSTTNSVSTSSHTHALSANLSAWDGKHPDNYLEIEGGYGNATSNLDTISSTGIFRTESGATGSPGNYQAVLSLVRASTRRAQLAINTTGSEPTFNVRMYGGSWSPWRTVWHDGNLNPSDYAPTSRTITAGNGLTGGGTLAANRTITLGTPGTITATSTNSVSSTGHTHNLDTTGNFTWTGNHTFIGDAIARSSSASRQLTVERTGNSINAAVAYTTTGDTTVYAGQGDSGFFSWGTNTDIRWSHASTWGRIGADGLQVKGKVEASGIVSSSNAYIRGGSSAAIFSFNGTTTGSTIYFRPRGDASSTNQTVIDWDGSMTVGGSISDSIGNVRKPDFRTANGTITLASSDVNRVVEKSNNSSYTYTIPSGHGSHGDIITFVNSGTSGNLTINRATGVTLYRNGTNANITVGPGSTVTVYRSATANRWIA